MSATCEDRQAGNGPNATRVFVGSRRVLAKVQKALKRAIGDDAVVSVVPANKTLDLLAGGGDDHLYVRVELDAGVVVVPSEVTRTRNGLAFTGKAQRHARRFIEALRVAS